MRKLTTFFLFMLFYLSSCNKTNPVEMELPQASGGCLVTPKMFTEEWKWSEEKIYSFESQPSTDNHYLNTKIILMMTGRNESKGQKLEISSQLNVYNNPIDWTEDINYPPNDEISLQIHPKFVDLGKETQIGCIKDETVSVCVIMAIYNTHMLRITATGSYISSESDMENILNPVLSNINGCISDLEKAP